MDFMDFHGFSNYSSISKFCLTFEISLELTHVSIYSIYSITKKSVKRFRHELNFNQEKNGLTNCASMKKNTKILAFERKKNILIKSSL